MRIPQIRNIPLPHLPSDPLLLLLTQSTGCRDTIPPPILPHIPSAPGADEHEFGSEEDRGPDRPGNIPGTVLGSEDLRSDHVADAVP